MPFITDRNGVTTRKPAGLLNPRRPARGGFTVNPQGVATKTPGQALVPYRNQSRALTVNIGPAETKGATPNKPARLLGPRKTFAPAADLNLGGTPAERINSARNVAGPRPGFVNDTTSSEPVKGPARRRFGSAKDAVVNRGRQTLGTARSIGGGLVRGGGALMGADTLLNAGMKASRVAGDPEYSLGDAALDFSRDQLNSLGGLVGKPEMGTDYINGTRQLYGLSPRQEPQATTPIAGNAMAATTPPEQRRRIASPVQTPYQSPGNVTILNQPTDLTPEEQTFLASVGNGESVNGRLPARVSGAYSESTSGGKMGAVAFRRKETEKSKAPVVDESRTGYNEARTRLATAIAKAADDVAHGRGTPSHGRALLLKQIGSLGEPSTVNSLDASMKRSRLRGQELTNQKAIADMMRADPKRFKTEVVTDIEGNPSIITIDQQTGEGSIRLPDGSVQRFSGREGKGKDQVMVDDAGNFSFRGLSLSREEARKRMGG